MVSPQVVLESNTSCFIFIYFLADALLTQPVDREAAILPTVSQLKRKIILKHKKLSGNNETFTVPAEECECKMRVDAPPPPLPWSIQYDNSTVWVDKEMLQILLKEKKYRNVGVYACFLWIKINI